MGTVMEERVKAMLGPSLKPCPERGEAFRTIHLFRSHNNSIAGQD